MKTSKQNQGKGKKNFASHSKLKATLKETKQEETPTTSTSSLSSSNRELPDGYKLVIQRARENLIDFSIATNQQYEPNWHHELISQELEKIEQVGDRDYKVLLVFVPPRHGKSELCSIGFPAWYLGRNPTKEIITVSYSAELAQDFGSKTRGIVGGEVYPHIFNISLKEDAQAKAKWRTSKGGSYTSVGVGGAVTGRGAHILLFDDPIKNREEAESEVYREKVWQFFTSTAFTRLEPGGVVVVILTRWHVDDLAGRILKNPELSKRIKIIHFPAIAEKDEQYRKQGEALWPERFGIKALTEIKNTIGPYDWNALYQGSPVLTESQEFKPVWFQPITEGQVQAMNCRRFLTVDTAMSKKAQADYTAWCDNRVNQQNSWHLKVGRGKLSPEELVNLLFVLNTNAIREGKPYEAIGIEKTAYLEGLKPYLDQEQRKRNTFLPIVELQHKMVNKEIRIRGLIPRYASLSVFHLENECRVLEEEMAQFPMGLHDDVLDAVAYQLQIADSAYEANNMAVTVSIPDDW